MFRNTLALTTILGVGMLAACDTRDRSTNTTAPNPAPNKADNTARNAQDADTNNKTPVDQSENAEDIRITSEIRRSILENNAMSINAQNVKIITAAGVVTLRGPVASQSEKDSIDAIAKAVVGVTRVDNQLEVKTP